MHHHPQPKIEVRGGDTFNPTTVIVRYDDGCWVRFRYGVDVTVEDSSAAFIGLRDDNPDIAAARTQAIDGYAKWRKG